MSSALKTMPRAPTPRRRREARGRVVPASNRRPRGRVAFDYEPTANLDVDRLARLLEGEDAAETQVRKLPPVELTPTPVTRELAHVARRPSEPPPPPPFRPPLPPPVPRASPRARPAPRSARPASVHPPVAEPVPPKGSVPLEQAARLRPQPAPVLARPKQPPAARSVRAGTLRTLETAKGPPRREKAPRETARVARQGQLSTGWRYLGILNATVLAALLPAVAAAAAIVGTYWVEHPLVQAGLLYSPILLCGLGPWIAVTLTRRASARRVTTASIAALAGLAALAGVWVVRVLAPELAGLPIAAYQADIWILHDAYLAGIPPATAWLMEPTLAGIWVAELALTVAAWIRALR